MLLLLFFFICAGLGYASLRRFDPRDFRTNFDSSHVLYHAQATGDAQEASPYSPLLHYRYRLLVPLVARPFFRFANGRLGTWEPGYFGLLVANALFCSWTSLLLFALARDVFGQSALALLAPLLYMLSFAVTNYHLAGLIDTGEAWAMMALVWCLRRQRWAWLPLLGVFGTLAKETFVPLSIAFAGAWMFHSGRDGAGAIGWLVLMGLAALVTLTVVFSVANGHVVFLWDIERSGVTNVSLWQRTARLANDHAWIYVFGWLVPLGMFGITQCPGGWLRGVLACAAVIVALGIYNGEPSVTRSLFDVAGPLLALSSAVALSHLVEQS